VGEQSRSISRTGVIAVLVFAALNVAVFFVRALSIWRYGSLFEVSGGESQMIYSVWKQIHNVPVYQNPFTYPFSLTLYNYLFYESYAAFIRLVGAQGADIVTWGRNFTPAFAVAGAIAQWRLIQDRLNLRRSLSLLSLFFAIGLWLSTSIVRYWALSIRPDVPAIALAMIALWVIVRRPRFAFAYAGVLFYLAWSFKQSIVLIFVGVCLFLLFHKRWRDLTALVAFYAALIAITLWLGTPEYRFSVLVAPRLVTGFSLSHALPPAGRALAGNVYWVLAFIPLLMAAGVRKADSTVRLLVTALAVALVGGVAAMTKAGAWDNYLLEAFVAGSTLLQIAVFSVPGRVVGALVMLGCLQPAVQLATQPSGHVWRHGHNVFGTVGLATAQEYKEAVALNDQLMRLKKPVFSSEEFYGLPWISNDNRVPGLIIDHIFHDALRARYVNGGVDGLLERGEIPTLVLQTGETQYLKSMNPKYKKVGEFVYCGAPFLVFELDQETPAPAAQ